TTITEDLKAMLKPYDPAFMEAYAVSRAVNSVKNDTQECILPIGEPVLELKISEQLCVPIVGVSIGNLFAVSPSRALRCGVKLKTDGLAQTVGRRDLTSCAADS